MCNFYASSLFSPILKGLSLLWYSAAVSLMGREVAGGPFEVRNICVGSVGLLLWVYLDLQQLSSWHIGCSGPGWGYDMSAVSAAILVPLLSPNSAPPSPTQFHPSQSSPAPNCHWTALCCHRWQLPESLWLVGRPSACLQSLLLAATKCFMALAWSLWYVHERCR